MSIPTPSQISCPVCGSMQLTKQIRKKKIGDRFTGSAEIDEVIYECQECKQKGDFAHQNDDVYKSAVNRLIHSAMPKMMKELNEAGISMAHFERCFELPQRTTARWKREGASAAAVALMKTVITYPWLLEAAEKNFDSNEARKILMRQGIEAIESSISSFAINQAFKYSAPSSDQLLMYYSSAESSLQSHQHKNQFFGLGADLDKNNYFFEGKVSASENNELARAS